MPSGSSTWTRAKPTNRMSSTSSSFVMRYDFRKNDPSNDSLVMVVVHSHTRRFQSYAAFHRMSKFSPSFDDLNSRSVRVTVGT